MFGRSLQHIVELSGVAALAVVFGVMVIRLRRQRRALHRAIADLRQTEDRFRRLAESSPLGVFELDATGRRVYANPRLIEMTDGADGVAEGLTFPWHLPEEDVAARYAEWRAASAALVPCSGRWRVLRPDGELRWIRFDAAPLIRDEALTGWIGSVTDVTEEQELADRHAHLSQILEATPDLVAMVEEDGAIAYANAAARAVLGVSAFDELTGRSAFDSYDRRSYDILVDEAIPTALRDGVWAGELNLQRSDGRAIPVSQVLVAHTRTDGTRYFSSISRDVSERKAFEAQLVYQGLHDALTGLPNRVLFSDRLAIALARAPRHGGTTAVFLLDLDHFKLVNDSYGHEAGDALLKATRKRIEEVIRPGDTAARFGGDEFAILCEDLMDQGQAFEMAERLAGAIAAPFDLDREAGTAPGAARVFLTASIGFSIPGEAATPESLLRDADAALNRAKADGRARTVLFVEDHRKIAVHRLRTANDLHRALADEEFRVVFQPEVSLMSGRLVGVEALVRWHHPDRGLVPPAEFVPLAEETGIVVPIGAWVLERAAEQAALWARVRNDGAAFTVWVNLSARQLSEDSLVDQVAATLRRYGVPQQALGLEITESALLEDADGAAATLGALRQLGVRLAVDDFGTGYSSLAYLKQLPVDQLKIDRSFVFGLESDADAAAIVAAVTGMARALRLTTVAEGVETPGQVDALRRVECDIAQGYFFTTPQPTANVTRLLEADRHSPLFPPARRPGPALRLAAVGGVAAPAEPITLPTPRGPGQPT